MQKDPNFLLPPPTPLHTCRAVVRRQQQLQVEHDRAEDDVFAKVALKEKLDKEVCGGHGLRNREEGEGEWGGRGGEG